jgi:hypothetical protein
MKPLLSALQTDAHICHRYPALCNLKDFLLTYLRIVPGSEEANVLDSYYLLPAFSKVSQNQIKLDDRIKYAILNNEHTDPLSITDIRQIPLILYIKLFIERFNVYHSWNIIIIPDLSTNIPLIFGIGLKNNDRNRNQVMIDTPHIRNDIFNIVPLRQSQPKYVIKAVELLTISFLKNFNKILNPETIIDVENGKELAEVVGSETKMNSVSAYTNLKFNQNNINCDTYNCASFSHSLSKQNSILSVTSNIGEVISVPSFMRSTHHDVNHLNDFVEAVLNNNNEFAIGWILHLSHHKKRMAPRTWPGYLRETVFGKSAKIGYSSKFGFGRRKKKRKHTIKRKKLT